MSAIIAALLLVDVDFSSALSASKPGARVHAPIGTLSVDLRNKTFSPPITIVGGTFSTIQIVNGGGVRFLGATIEPVEKPARGTAVYLLNSIGVSFEDVKIRSSNRDINGVNAVGSSGISFRRTTFEHLFNGFRGLRVRGIEISDGLFSDIAADSIGLGGPSYVVISRNTFLNADVVAMPHPDAIQIWDIAGTASSDILIEGNVLNVASQGIFVKSEGVGGFDRVRIIGNDVTAGYQHALTLTNARDSEITGNRVRTRNGARNMAKLNLTGVVRLKLSGNSACKTNFFGDNDVSVNTKNKWNRDC